MWFIYLYIVSFFRIKGSFKMIDEDVTMCVYKGEKQQQKQKQKDQQTPISGYFVFVVLFFQI